MRVVEAGRCEPAAEIDDARRRTDKGCDLGLAAGGQDPILPYRHRFDDALGAAAPDRAVPQASIEFDVADAAAVTAAAEELQQAGYELLHPPREEPWGQTVARLQSPEGVIVGLSYAPTLHR